MENKIKNSKNLKIKTSIVLTTVLSIIIPMIIIGVFFAVFMGTMDITDGLYPEDDAYGVINQIEWPQTIEDIALELDAQSSDSKKQERIKELAAPLEKINTAVYVEKDGEAIYSTKGVDVIKMAESIVPVDKKRNINYFASNGLVIVNQLNTSDNNSRIVIANSDYTVDNANEKNFSTEKLQELVLGRTGFIILMIVLLFVIAITVISSITSKTILIPIKKIVVGAEEIAGGNLDYSIDYKSKNELGLMVDSFNNMRVRLKALIDKQSKEAEEKRVLIAGIAHDLRTPLTSAKGYAEGILDGIADTPEKKDRYIKTVCQSINQTEKILDDLLTVSTLSLGGYKLNLENVNVCEFFSDGASDIKRILEKENFEYIYECNCSENATVKMDADRFVRVIDNIIYNSIKYRNKDIKGKIVMTLNEYERSVILQISDNGIGVDEESLGKIFDTMYRADPARTRVYDGSGLGLSICKQIIEMHGGTIWASSKQGEGLSIYISMPKKE